MQVGAAAIQASFPVRPALLQRLPLTGFNNRVLTQEQARPSWFNAGPSQAHVSSHETVKQPRLKSPILPPILFWPPSYSSHQQAEHTAPLQEERPHVASRALQRPHAGARETMRGRTHAAKKERVDGKTREQPEENTGDGRRGKGL